MSFSIAVADGRGTRDLLDGRARAQPLRAGMSRADGFVVRVEQVPEVGVEGLVAGEPGIEDEGLEEPGGVTAVPLRGAHVGHRLDDLVLRSEGSGERLGEVAHPAVSRAQLRACVVAVGRTAERGHSPSEPKQAATHAALRMGASHSTTEIIQVPLCTGRASASDFLEPFRSRSYPGFRDRPG
jgi:hypothetical protein